jgi:hypothetical protein
MSKGEVVVTHGVRVGRDARVSQERGPRGGERNKFTTIPEYRKAPPTS